ncbi:MAG: hypothetical protein COA32_15920 [Fluviicola sp.]|nr:MAG: hypothetical protein COA32_15920 [Fluviicola sp.]
MEQNLPHKENQCCLTFYTYATAITVLFLISFHNFSYTQISNPNSVTFTKHSPINTNTKKSKQHSPQSNGSQNHNRQPNGSMGGNANDLRRQMQRQAQQRMGFKPPPVPSSDPALRHQFITQQAQLQKQNKQQQQIAAIKALLNENLPSVRTRDDYLFKITKHYRQAFDKLMKMKENKTSFSLKESVFIVENAYADDTLDYKRYNRQIAIKVQALNMLMKKERIATDNNLGKNYAIQKLFSERIVEFKDTVVWRVHKPYQYEFDDFLGEEDWSNMFITKLLNTGKGQCHSMPLLYLILAEEINAKAWLSLAPEHSFVVFNDGRTFLNFETTNGYLVTEAWMMESGYINSMAIKNKIYLDTLGKDALISTLLADLAMGYIDKFGYDDFVVTMTNQLLQMNPKSIQGQILKADLLAMETKRRLQKVGNPPIEEINQYPEANQAYNALLEQYDFIDMLGYKHMPKEVYASWLASLNDEKHQQEKKKLKTSIIRSAKAGN